MRKIKIIITSIVGLAIIIALVFFIFGFLKPKYAGIYIDTNPTSTIYIDGEEMGRTPYKKTIKPNEIEIKLVPDSFQLPLYPFETKIDLVAGVETVIKREFGETEELSSGEILSFEKGIRDETSLSVITIPDSGKLIIDRKDKAFTPHKTSAILPGNHILELSASGFVDKEIQVKTHSGYKLTAFVQLSKVAIQNNEEFEVATSAAGVEQGSEKVMVKIKSTPTGFLRVREEASSIANEVGRVIPGKTYILLEQDEKTGWYKIEFNEETDSKVIKSGWISNQYAERIDSNLEKEASPSAKKS
ncbi:hypothetical protein A2159_00210 [Candidatus Woesebacteria bacterium RBG_13_34_9]|uniref:SH3b domain-containing protein n=1 Tax=Candidatus Woesebacteria bacterium RBG_13_34_9 TaxID=1802477 RepID=A0A1F7X3H4_9BACT|nr:MAG: hypothetical protein A2159_00210 [Candidatus Woesebacteria bacterium RBG_13_34_9]